MDNKKIIKWGLILLTLVIFILLFFDFLFLCNVFEISKNWSFFLGYFQLHFNWNIWLIRIITIIFVFLYIIYVFPNIIKMLNPFRPHSKKQIPALIIVCFLCILWFITYLSEKGHNFNADGESLSSMAWAVDHYEEIKGNFSVHPVYGTKVIKVTPENFSIFNLKKIEVDDDTIFFNPYDGTPQVYYYVLGSKVDFFNSKGIHPQYGEELKPVTQDFIKNYFLQRELTRSNKTDINEQQILSNEEEENNQNDMSVSNSHYKRSNNINYTNERLISDTSYSKFGQAWENDGVLLNLVKLIIRANDDYGDAAVQAWFYFINYSGQRILVNTDWDNIYITDNLGIVYRDWEGGNDNRWIENGDRYSFYRYYTINRQQRSRVPVTANYIKIIANQFSRIKNASWIYYLNPEMKSISSSLSEPSLNIGETVSEKEILLTITDIEVRADQKYEDAAIRVWFSIKNNSTDKKPVILNYSHIIAEDSFGKQFIDWNGKVETFWLDSKKEYKFNRYYSEMEDTRSRMTIGSEFILVKINNFGGISNALWRYDIVY